MNGFIATLLSLMMTAIAVTQQPQSSKDASIPNSGQTTSLLGKYLLIIDDDLVNGLIAQGYLSSPVHEDVRSSIDHIVFHGSERNSLRTDMETGSIQPIPPTVGSTKLQFLLSDHDLRTMQERGLRYIIPPNDRGRFNEVAVLYGPPNRSLATTPDASKLDEISNQHQIANRQQPFIGPQLPDNWEYRSPVNQQLQNGEDAFRPRLGTVATRPNNFENVDSRAGYTDPGLRGNFDSQRSSNRDIIPGLNGTNGFSAPSYLAADAGNRDDSGIRNAQQRELDQLARENDELKQKLQEFDISQSRSNREPRYASTANPAIGDEYDYPYARDARSPIRNPTGSFPTRYADDQVFVNSLNQSEVHQLPPERMAATPRLTNGLLPLATTGTDTKSATPPATTTTPQTIDQKILAENELTQKQNRALWFIMLCSVGLNFYLSWIARGFYVRYEELAEEIRESFTSTG